MTAHLEGVRCLVRPWRAGDADALTLHANDPAIARQLRDRFPHPYLRRHAREFLQQVTGSEPITSFAIEVDGQAVGGIGFVPGTDVERFSAEIGYWLGTSLWGRGIATEALVLVTNHAFGEVNVLRLFAVPFADNMASRRVLEKAGYVCEGILRSSSVKAGEPRDQAMYARVNPDWRS